MKTLEDRSFKMMLNMLITSLGSLPTADPGAGGAALARKWPARSEINVRLVTTTGEPRCARLQVSYGRLRHPIGAWAARFWEDDAPAGEEPVEWVLLSRRALTATGDAVQLLSATHGLVSTCEEC